MTFGNGIQGAARAAAQSTGYMAPAQRAESFDPAAIEKMRAEQRAESERFQRQNARSNLLAELIKRGDPLDQLVSKLPAIDRLVEYAVSGKRD